MKLYRLALLAICALMINSIAYAQQSANVVISFTPGEGQNSGQSAEYFPANVFNLPIPTASELVPSTAPENVLSLGLDGEIILSFKDLWITDEEGPDFTVFENVFKNPINGKFFIEPGQVSVSQDGIEFVAFPFDSLTLQGCAGITPTNGASDPFNPKTSGGDKFDLKLVGMQSAKYIKIKDISRFLREDESHPYHDFTISGFDLDAVAGLHLAQSSSAPSEGRPKAIDNDYEFLLEAERDMVGWLYSITGIELDKFSGKSIRVDKNKYPSQALILITSSCEGYTVYKIMI